LSRGLQRRTRRGCRSQPAKGSIESVAFGCSSRDTNWPVFNFANCYSWLLIVFIIEKTVANMENFNDSVKAFKRAAWTSKGMASNYKSNTDEVGNIQDCLTDKYLETLTSRIERSAHILDLGCGTGATLLRLARLGYKIDGIDISEEMLRLIPIDEHPGKIKLYRGDVFKVGLPDNSYDALVTRWVIPHFADWPRIIGEGVRLLKPGGFFLFDMCSIKNYRKENGAARTDYTAFGYDPRVESSSPQGFYSAASESEIELVARTYRCDVVEVSPLSFFVQNALLFTGMGAEKYAAYKTDMGRFYSDPRIGEFIRYFEGNITPHLPPEVFNCFSVLLRKK
jgi:ubiquinone/menaquinone biosynthesis C-methylase UbiE